MDRRIASLTLTFTLVSCLEQLPSVPEVFDEESSAPPCTGKCDGDSEIAALGALPDATLATLFAPYEPALELDLLLIEQVTAARAADPATYPEGANPFRIRFAVYNLDNPHIAAALADAEAANVDVQILIEKDQLDPARDYNVMDDFLVGRGFELAPDHRNLDEAGRRTADLIGISGSGLMHLKTRTYTWVDPETHAASSRVVSGSMNPGNLAVHNDETLHYIALPDVVARYDAKFEAVLRGQRLTNTWSDTAAAQVLFTPDGGVQAIDRIAQLIDGEQEAILLAVFSLRNMAPTTGGKGILERLVDAHRRGVPVVVITDRKQSDGVDSDGNPLFANDASEEILRSAGVTVYEVLNNTHTPFNAMHAKYGIFGISRPIVVTDAGNWSRASLGSGTTRPINDESVLFLDTQRLDGGLTGRRYLGNFLEILHRYGTDGLDGHTSTGGPVPATVLARLQALAGWPTSEVVFSARADTRFGEQVHVTGDHTAIGDWTRRGSWPLTTDASTYPQWTAAPLTLPFGTRLAYKLIKRAGSEISWESGANRTLAIDPTDRRVNRDASTMITAALQWR